MPSSVLNMSSFSLWHWVIVIALIAFAIFPFWRILNKAGFSGAWSFLTLVPVVNLVVIWVFAFVTWPVEKKQ